MGPEELCSTSCQNTSNATTDGAGFAPQISSNRGWMSPNGQTCQMWCTPTRTRWNQIKASQTKNIQSPCRHELSPTSKPYMYVYLTRALFTIRGDMQRIHTHRSSFALPVQNSLGILIGRQATKRSQLSSPMIYTPIKVSPTYYYTGKRHRSGPDHLVEVCAVVYQKKGLPACLNFSAYLMCWTQFGDPVPTACQLTTGFDRPRS